MTKRDFARAMIQLRLEALTMCKIAAFNKKIPSSAVQMIPMGAYAFKIVINDEEKSNKNSFNKYTWIPTYVNFIANYCARKVNGVLR